MNCPDQQSIFAFADCELGAAQAAEIERHLAECAGCRQLVEELRALDRLGRASLASIRVEEPSTSKIVRLRPPQLQRVRPMTLTAIAAVVLALLTLARSALSHWRGNQTHSVPQQMESYRAATQPAAIAAKQSADAAFAQWIAPYLELNIPRVSLEVAASYSPPPAPAVLPDALNKN
jgi:anti-sigma factor RsiW